MTSPDLETLFNVEPAIEGAWKKLLERDELKGFTSRETADLPLNRVDIQLVLGGSNGHRHIHHGRAWLDAWAGQLTLGIVTTRRAVDPTGEFAKLAAPADPLDVHNQARARIRIRAQYASDELTELVLPYHTLTKIQDAGTSPTVKTMDDCDVSEITFDCLVSIRSNAWPA